MGRRSSSSCTLASRSSSNENWFMCKSIRIKHYGVFDNSKALFRLALEIHLATFPVLNPLPQIQRQRGLVGDGGGAEVEEWQHARICIRVIGKLTRR